MRNLKKLMLVTGMGAIMAAVSMTGCKTSSSSSDRTEGRALDDKNITASVQEKLAGEPVYKFTDVDVKTFSGVVQLSGFVNTQDQKQRAGEIAQRVDGVSQVVNHISLKPNMSPTGRGTNDMIRPAPENQ